MIPVSKIPHGYKAIVAMFGDFNAPNFEKTYISSIIPPYPLFYEGREVRTIRCHRLAAGNFKSAFQAVLDAGLSREFKEFNGIYNVRPIKSSSKPSLHSFGIAIDMLASQFPLGSKKRMDPRIVECFTRFGFTYGGDFRGRKDPMHFQLATGY